MTEIHQSGNQVPAAGRSESALQKERLALMFRQVPLLLEATTVEGKLQVVAESLVGRMFFTSCHLWYETPDQGILEVFAGVREGGEDGDRWNEWRGILAERQAPLILPVSDQGTASRVVAPILKRGGQMTGVAELIATDSSLWESEMLDLIEVYLTEASQSIEQLIADRKLEKSEALYRSLINNVTDVIFQIDRDGKIVFVSRRVCDLLGITWKDALGRNACDFIHPRDVDRGRRAFEEVLSGRPVSTDLAVNRLDGSEATVFVSCNPIKSSDEIIGGLGVARDVTEKRKLEEQVRESERRYRALTENAYDAIFLVDPQTTQIVDANPQAEMLTGYSRSDLLKMSVEELRRAEHRFQVRERLNLVMKAGVGRFEDVPIVRKDGSEVNVDTAASVYEIEGKRYYQAILRDVSAQHQMTEALNRRVMELQILSEVSDALQSTVDLQTVMSVVLAGVTAGKGLGFNRAFIFSYDRTANELRGEAGIGPGSAEEAGRIWADLERKGLTLSEILEQKIRTFPEDTNPANEFARRTVIPLDDFRSVFLKAILNRETIRVDLTQEDAHVPEDFLRQYWATEFAIVPLVTRDDVMGILLVDNLFTRRPIKEEDLHRLKLFANSAASAIERSRLLISLEKRLHELTLANQDLKASRDRLIKTERLSAVGEVAASVAHEIRNPLTAIGGFARSAYNSLEDGDKNKHKLQVILEEVDRLESILSALLEFTRPVVPRFTQLDINALLMQTVHFMDRELDGEVASGASPSGIKVTCQLDPDLPKAWADGNQMRQVFLNIIRNAVQAIKNKQLTDERKRLARSGSTEGSDKADGHGLVSISTTEEDGLIRVSISDNGPGIPQENIDKIFEAFFTTKASGSGLGLAICSQIVRNHNGRIEVNSKVGEGATFVITLPVAQNTLDSY